MIMNGELSGLEWASLLGGDVGCSEGASLPVILKGGAGCSETDASDDEWGAHSPVGEWSPDRYDTQVVLNDVPSDLEMAPLFGTRTSYIPNCAKGVLNGEQAGSGRAS